MRWRGNRHEIVSRLIFTSSGSLEKWALVHSSEGQKTWYLITWYQITGACNAALLTQCKHFLRFWSVVKTTLCLIACKLYCAVLLEITVCLICLNVSSNNFPWIVENFLIKTLYIIIKHESFSVELLLASKSYILSKDLIDFFFLHSAKQKIDSKCIHLYILCYSYGDFGTAEWNSRRMFESMWALFDD